MINRPTSKFTFGKTNWPRFVGRLYPAYKILSEKLVGDYFAFLHVEVVDDDTDEEIEREEGAEDNVDDEVHVHVAAVLPLRLLTCLHSINTTPACIGKASSAADRTKKQVTEVIR